MTSMSSWRSPWTRVLLVVVGLLAGVGVGGTAAFYVAVPARPARPAQRRGLSPAPRDHGRRSQRQADRRVLRGAPPAGRRSPRSRATWSTAFVSAEDRTFFEHKGIDFTSILRAAWKNLLAGGKVEGASTITQQMVKGLLLSPERTYTRKIREMILARRIEQRFTKQEILYLYLNQIYFGHGAYGIGEAARTYFGKPVGELTVSEAAQLAGPAQGAVEVLADQPSRARRAAAPLRARSHARGRRARRVGAPARARGDAGVHRRRDRRGLRRRRLLHRGGAALSVLGARRRAGALGRAARRDDARRRISSTPRWRRCAPGSRRSITATATAGRCGASRRRRSKRRSRGSRRRTDSRRARTGRRAAPSRPRSPRSRPRMRPRRRPRASSSTASSRASSPR